MWQGVLRDNFHGEQFSLKNEDFGTFCGEVFAFPDEGILEDHS